MHDYGSEGKVRYRGGGERIEGNVNGRRDG